MLNIKDFVTHGNIDAALALAKQTNTPIARLIEKGIKRIGRPLNDISTAIENEGKLEVYKLERSLPLLATVAGAAPMIGFLGTVWAVSYTHLRAHETVLDLVCRLLLEKKNHDI